jgi:hypothetical protein
MAASEAATDHPMISVTTRSIWPFSFSAARGFDAIASEHGVGHFFRLPDCCPSWCVVFVAGGAWLLLVEYLDGHSEIAMLNIFAAENIADL